VSEGKGRRGAGSIVIHFGCLCPPIHKQLGVKSDKTWERLQRRADEIAGLVVESILTESEGHKARGRLMKKIVAHAYKVETVTDKEESR
jgi:hypothetical protein